MLEGRIKTESGTENAHSNSHTDDGGADKHDNHVDPGKRKRADEEHQNANGVGEGDEEGSLHTSRYLELLKNKSKCVRVSQAALIDVPQAF